MAGSSSRQTTSTLIKHVDASFAYCVQYTWDDEEAQGHWIVIREAPYPDIVLNADGSIEFLEKVNLF